MEKKFKELLFCQVLDRNIHLTPERFEHILIRHPELKNLEYEFSETILLPDYILTRPTGEYLLVRWYPLIFNGKYMVIVVKPDLMRYWIITSYLSRKFPLGEYHEY